MSIKIIRVTYMNTTKTKGAKKPMKEKTETYLARKHKQYYSHLTWKEFIVNEKLECVHVALQELQQEFNIPDNNIHLEDAFTLTEGLRDELAIITDVIQEEMIRKELN